MGSYVSLATPCDVNAHIGRVPSARSLTVLLSGFSGRTFGHGKRLDLRAECAQLLGGLLPALVCWDGDLVEDLGQPSARALRRMVLGARRYCLGTVRGALGVSSAELASTRLSSATLLGLSHERGVAARSAPFAEQSVAWLNALRLLDRPLVLPAARSASITLAVVLDEDLHP